MMEEFFRFWLLILTKNIAKYLNINGREKWSTDLEMGKRDEIIDNFKKASFSYRLKFDILTKLTSPKFS